MFSSEHAIEEYGEVYEALRKHEDADDPMGLESDSEGESWRNRVRTLIQNIIEPADLDWMEDGDTLSNEDYLIRGMESIIARLDRYVFDTSPNSNVSD